MNRYFWGSFIFLTFIVGLILFVRPKAYETYKPIAFIGKNEATSVDFDRPVGIAIDTKGDVFVSNSGTNQIIKLKPEGTVIKQWDGTPHGALRRPMHISFDSKNNLYVAEFLNDRIQVFDTEGRTIRFIGLKKDGSSYFDGPAGVAVDQHGNIYVADFFHHQIQKFDANGAFVSFIGSPGSVWSGRLHYPTDVAIDDGVLYVADAYNNRIQVATLQGNFIQKWGGFWGLGIVGSLTKFFNVATGITVDNQNNIYVADFYNHRIQKIDANGNSIALFGASILRYPTDVAVDTHGHVWVVDFGNDRLVTFKMKEEE